MINLAVIEIKDVIKYLVRITLIITIVIGLTRYFFSFKTQVNDQTEKIKNVTFLSCLDTTIPGIKEINRQEKINEEKKITNTTSPLKMALGVELGMMNTLTKQNEERGNNMQEQIDNEKEENTEKIEENTEAIEEKIEEAEVGLATEVQDTNVPEKFTSTYHTVKIKNETDIKLTEEMLTPNVSINTENILIYHTHSCESYTQSEKYKYKASGNFRTTDIQYSVVRVGTELEKYMKNYGYNVIHDTTLYDYPSYSESYDRSLKSVGELIEKNEGTEVLFDIHRDAIRR